MRTCVENIASTMIILLKGPVLKTREGARAQLVCVSPGGKPAADVRILKHFLFNFFHFLV